MDKQEFIFRTGRVLKPGSKWIINGKVYQVFADTGNQMVVMVGGKFFFYETLYSFFRHGELSKF